MTFDALLANLPPCIDQLMEGKQINQPTNNQLYF